MTSHDAPVAALDVGGTTLKPGVVRGSDVELLPPLPAHANDDADIVLTQLAAACHSALEAAGPRVAGLAVDVPRPFDLAAGIPLMRGLHKYDAVHGIALRPILRERTAIGERPIVFVGDAEAAAVGEALHGAGRRWGRVLTLTLGTGMGACLTADGGVVPAVGGTIVEDLHDREVDGRRADDVFSVRGLAASLGVAPADLPTAVDDPANADGLADFGRRLGRFVRPLLDELRAEAVVIGGGLAGAFDRFGPSIGVAAAPIELGPRGPLLGAVALAGLP